MKQVFFLKPGTPYGYGYTAGEIGQVHEKPVTAVKSGKTVTIAWGFDDLIALKSGAVVRELTKAEAAAIKSAVSEGEKA